MFVATALALAVSLASSTSLSTVQNTHGIESRSQVLAACFTKEGAEVRGEGWVLGLTLESWGRDGLQTSVRPTTPNRSGARIEYARGPVIEWYLQDERGVEQGFTVFEEPEGEGALLLAMAVRGALTGEVLPGGRDLILRDAKGEPTVQYTGLMAWDAEGRELEARLELEGDRLSIRVRDDGAAYPLIIDPWIQQAKLTAGDPELQAAMGNAVEISGDTIVAGAQSKDEAGVDSGAAYVFVRNGSTWTEQAKLVPADGQTGDQFGESVTICGDTIVVGAHVDDDNGLDSGSAYVFVRTGTAWTEQMKLLGSDVDGDDRFGQPVSLDGDTLLVGAHNKGGGAAYVFVRTGTTWSEEAKLTASGTSGFGLGVSLCGDTALIGSHNDNAGIGSAYVFTRIGTVWTEEVKLTASDGVATDQFGVDLSLSGGSVLIGTSGAQAAYVFSGSGASWVEEAVLTASDPEISDSFGLRVSLDGDQAVVGAYRKDSGGPDSGAAYVFDRSGTTWSELIRLDGEKTSHDFGFDVGNEGDTVVTGARGFDVTSGGNEGAVYAYHMSPVITVKYCTAGISASGCNASVWAAGTASATATSGFVMAVTNVEGGKDALFFFGNNGRQANPWGNGTSFQCVVPPVTRAGLLVGGGTSGLCDGSFAQDLNALWCSTCPKPAKNPGQGAVVQAQLWYRDPFNTSSQTTSLSDAVEFCVGP